METKEKTTAKDAVRELTLALLFLNRFREFEGKKAKRLAAENNVLLINGLEFCRRAVAVGAVAL